jgi:hypothetical protein
MLLETCSAWRLSNLLVIVLSTFAPLVSAHPSIRGTVVDVTGGALRSVSVRVLKSESNLLVSKVNSDEKGFFEVDSLTTGSYTVTAWVSGFRLGRWEGIVIREGEIQDLGKLQLDFGGCDAPGVICDTFTSKPAIPGLVKKAEITLRIGCGADVTRGVSSCPADKWADFMVTKADPEIDVEALNRSAIYSPDTSFDQCKSLVRSDPKIRVDGFGPGQDFCVRRKDSISHVFVLSEIDANSTEVRILLTTTKPSK